MKAQRQPRQSQSAGESRRRPRPRPQEVVADLQGYDSPALELQQRLATALTEAESPIGQWSLRGRVLFLLAAGAGCWALIISAGLGLSHLFK